MLTITYYTRSQTNEAQSPVLFRRLHFSYYKTKAEILDEVFSQAGWQLQEPALDVSQLQEISSTEAQQLQESCYRDQSIRSEIDQSDKPAKAIQRIKEKLDTLRRLDTGYKVHGAHKHRYILHPPLSPMHIAELEELYGISFPEGYQLFLQEIGSGGAGPGYGLYAIGDILPRMHKNTDYFQRAFEPPKSVEEDEERDEEGYPGLLALGTQGCDYTWYLVISGKERGTIWEDWADTWISPEGPRPSHVIYAYLNGQQNHFVVDYLLSPAYSQHYTFLQWYESWLDIEIRWINKNR